MSHLQASDSCVRMDQILIELRDTYPFFQARYRSRHFVDLAERRIAKVFLASDFVRIQIRMRVESGFQPFLRLCVRFAWRGPSTLAGMFRAVGPEAGRSDGNRRDVAIDSHSHAGSKGQRPGSSQPGRKARGSLTMRRFLAAKSDRRANGPVHSRPGERPGGRYGDAMIPFRWKMEIHRPVASFDSDERRIGLSALPGILRSLPITRAFDPRWDVSGHWP